MLLIFFFEKMDVKDCDINCFTVRGDDYQEVMYVIHKWISMIFKFGKNRLYSIAASSIDLTPRQRVERC